jgi:U6 snRNA phosphodiesterase
MDLLLDYDSDDSSAEPDLGAPVDPNYVDAQRVGQRQAASTKTAAQGDVGRVEIVTNFTFTRAEPHVRGNWAGHVFVRVESREALEGASSAVLRFRDLLEGDGYSCVLCKHEHYHLSLSRPFYLQEASIESFVSILHDRLHYQQAFTLKVLNRGLCFANESRNRTFWALPVETSDDLLSTVQAVDEALKHFNQPTYYNPPSFHVSVASVPLLVTEERILTEPQGLGSNQQAVHSISCTFGTTKTFEISLSH